MWSDRASEERIRELVAQVRCVLPAPSESASTVSRELSGNASLEQVAEILHHGPGFAWVTTKRGACLLPAPLASVTYFERRAVVAGADRTVEISGGGFEILEAVLEAWRGPSGAILAGFLSYDLVEEIEDLGPIPEDNFLFPRFHFGLFDSALMLENGHWRFEATDAWRNSEELFAVADDAIRRATSAIPIAPAPRSSFGVVSSRPNAEEFEAGVARIVETIHAGDIFQTNLCRCLETGLEPGKEWDLFRAMRGISPARYDAFLRVAPGQAVTSISPEMFLRVENGVVESSPIKGTRPRGGSAEEDRALSSELQSSGKDRAELAMIVDVTRNDLSRVCQAGSVEVLEHAKLMTLPTVHHLVSTVKGRLRPQAGLVELLKAAFPAASITGAPKIEAMRVALREEGGLRGPCMGAIGWISMDQRAEFSVAIRTACVAGGRVRYYAGCGITADSVPREEFAESSHKAAAFLRALGE